MTETAMLFLHALTGLHPGSGTALGVVDLPVQRERHTGWPTIPGTSLKGVIRAEARGREPDRKNESDAFLAVFGPNTVNAADHAGAIAFTDARILAFPVRSLQGVFAWVTCPAVLARLSRDRELAGASALEGVPKLSGDNALVCKASPLVVTDGNRPGMVLEEFDFTITEAADGIAEWIARHAISDAATQDRMRRHVAVISDDAFSHFVQHATEVTARIKLDYETKTVAKGALFYEEFLPAETLFYSLLIAQPARSQKIRMSAEQSLGWLSALGMKTIQVGGGETIGKGLCAIRIEGRTELRA
jgi:CRISPR-associated protein Cmr4